MGPPSVRISPSRSAGSSASPQARSRGRRRTVATFPALSVAAISSTVCVRSGNRSIRLRNTLKPWGQRHRRRQRFVALKLSVGQPAGSSSKASGSPAASLISRRRTAGRRRAHRRRGDRCRALVHAVRGVRSPGASNRREPRAACPEQYRYALGAQPPSGEDHASADGRSNHCASSIRHRIGRSSLRPKASQARPRTPETDPDLATA